MATNLEEKHIRARIESPFGVVETPYIVSFYTSKNRNQLDSFNCSLKIPNNKNSEGAVGNVVKIFAGVGSASKHVFTGYIMAVNARSCFEDPSYHIVDISGTDARKFLEGKVFTRRQQITERSWAEITSVNRRGMKSSKLQYTRKSDFSDTTFPGLDQNMMNMLQTTYADYLNKVAKVDIRSTGKKGFLEFKVVHEAK
jgi:hypothetical protein